RVRSLSPATAQLVAIARAMAEEPRVLLLDEPTSSLDSAEVEQLFLVLRRLRERGVAMVFASHFLEQVLAVSDRLTVLRSGRRVAEFPAHQVERSELISLMIRRSSASSRPIIREMSSPSCGGSGRCGGRIASTRRDPRTT